MQFLRRLVKYLFLFLACIGLILLSTFKKLDNTTYSGSEESLKTYSQLKGLKPELSAGQYFKTGWSKSNITPDGPVPVASYGIRPESKGVHDSLYARVFAFDNGNQQAYLITLDLLIFPPEVNKALKDSLGEKKYSKLYLTATHTHNGAGGWLKGIAARFFVGTFNKEYTDKIISGVLKALRNAEDSMEEVDITYGETDAPEFVKNRVINEGEIDETLRYITFKSRESEKKGILVTYSAHANCISGKENFYSGDYPAELSDSLEKAGFTFAAFAAGPVGSMANLCGEYQDYGCTKHIGKSLAGRILENKNLTPVNHYLLSVGKTPVYLKDPNPRIHDSYTIRPWVFNSFLGTQQPYISYLKIGDILLLGMPCDFSGEMGEEICRKHSSNKKIIFTSFNGTYVGYITPDHYQAVRNKETMEMNWFGPGSGSYFYQILEQLISKF